MDQDAKVERLLDMLRCAAEQLPEESMKDAEKLLSGRLLSKSLVKLAAELTGNDIKSLCDLISEAMDLTLWNAPSSPAVGASSSKNVTVSGSDRST